MLDKIDASVRLKWMIVKESLSDLISERIAL